MGVYVETNFLLELAYEQEQRAAAAALLGWAGSGRISLACPAFAVAEALANVDRRRARRNEAVRPLQAQARELSRSGPRQALADRLAVNVRDLGLVNDAEAQRARAVVSQMARVAALLPFDADVDAAARHLATLFDLSDQDAIVLAVISGDLAARGPDEPKGFVSRDAAAYTSAAVRAELRRFGCLYLTGFAAAADRVRPAAGLP